jgi:glycogen debranching enzyme
MLPVMLFALASAIHAQTTGQNFRSISAFSFDASGPVIRAHAETEKPFTVAGERGVVVGQQDGRFEAWVLPIKLLSHLTIEANIEGYSVPIDVNRQAAAIEVRPDRTVITYAHIGFTVRQIMFSPNGATAGTGPVVLFEFDCPHPTEFTFRFNPDLQWMWPARNQGVPGIEWVPGFEDGKATPGGTGGYYVLHSDYPDFAGAVTIAGARSGILAPYQERPQVHPVELKVHYDPVRDQGRLYPMLMAVGTTASSATSAALGETLERLSASIPELYKAHAESYKRLLANSVSIETPDNALDEAFRWAVISIEQLKARVPQVPAEASTPEETALVAGYYASGDSARPGFGWFFGRDALYTLYAVNGFGDFKLSRDQLEFLIRRQRDDGKIMHEYSQTAAFIDWRQFSYMYAAADATPLFLLAVLDYVRASGDSAFLTTHRDAIEKAWAFETDPAHDTDSDGIYDNSQGTGWVESWPPGMPHQEIYLALLDQQASAAMAQIATLLNNQKESQAAQARSQKIAKTIETEYYDQQKLCYAFSRNKDGSLDRTRTVYPALAWWDPIRPGGKESSASSLILAHGDECLQQFASHTLNTDWGLRDLANDEPLYDGMSYHQGSVWPLFTGWAALAEYRGGQPLAGYQILMENANLTHGQDLGAVTELLSGDFFVPFGRSTSHQLWSSAMVITPTLRGLFGISIDAQTKTITVNPRLPAGWDHAAIMNLQIPGGPTMLDFSRNGDRLEVLIGSTQGEGWHIRSDLPGTTFGPVGDVQARKTLRAAPLEGLRITLPTLEIDQALSSFPNVIDEVRSASPDQPPLPGARTSRLRILRSDYADRRLTLTVEGRGGSEAPIGLIRHGRFIPRIETQSPAVHGPNSGEAKISMRERSEDPAVPAMLVFDFPPGEGWKTITVTLTW